MLRIRGRVGVSSFDGGRRAVVDGPAPLPPTSNGATGRGAAVARTTGLSSSNGEADMADNPLEVEDLGPSASVGVCIQVAITSSSSAIHSASIFHSTPQWTAYHRGPDP